MALLNKRSRNIEGLLANRLTGGGTDRGTHGYNMGNKTFYDTKGQEGKNFLKAVDRYHNRDDWNKDLGGGQNFMQGPTGDSSDYVDPLMRMGDAETIDDHLTDVASNRAARNKLLETRLEDPENELDRNEMDSEALDEWHQDQASEIQTRMDKIDPSGPAIFKQSYADSETLSNLREDELSDLNADLGPDKMEQPGESIDESVPVPFGGLRDAFSGLFSSDDDEGGGEKKKKPMSKEAMKYGGDLLKGMMQEPAQSKRQMPTSKVTRGSVPFAGLLAQKAQRQRNPYFTPRGLV